MDETLQQLKMLLRSKNEEQEQIRQKKHDVAQYVVHGTHISPEELHVPTEIAEKFDKGALIFPKFSKETQNELDVIKEYSANNNSVNQIVHEEFQKQLEIPERIFALPVKHRGENAEFDENGIPIPQDGSYAYAIKKCSGCINFTEDDIPIVIGYEERYRPFEEGQSCGHLYILDGSTFKPEYDKNERITEWTSQEYLNVQHHLSVSPKDAMRHNAQFIIFKSEEDMDHFLTTTTNNKGESFNSVLRTDSHKMKVLAHEISCGNATYINASNRGVNPQIQTLTNAQKSYEEKLKVQQLRGLAPIEKHTVQMNQYGQIHRENKPKKDKIYYQGEKDSKIELILDEKTKTCMVKCQDKLYPLFDEQNGLAQFVDNQENSIHYDSRIPVKEGEEPIREDIDGKSVIKFGKNHEYSIPFSSQNGEYYHQMKYEAGGSINIPFPGQEGFKIEENAEQNAAWIARIKNATKQK